MSDPQWRKTQAKTWMVLATVRLLVMVAELSGKHEASSGLAGREAGDQCPGTDVER